MWIAHQNLLFGLQSHLVELCRVVAADAGAGRPTVSVIGEAFAVELEAAALTAIAGLVCHEKGLLLGTVLVGRRGRLQRCPIPTIVTLLVGVSVLTRLHVKAVGQGVLKRGYGRR